jgi:hypothetical protein
MESIMVNEKLAKILKISDENRVIINNTHSLLFNIVDNPEKYDNVVNLVETLEYSLQELWGFEKTSSKHAWWNKLKGCSCPKLDNDDLIGTGLRVYSEDCMWHGNI